MSKKIFLFILFLIFSPINVQVKANEDFKSTQFNQMEVDKIKQAIQNNQGLKCNFLDLKTNQIQTIFIKGDNIKLIDDAKKNYFVRSKKFFHIWNSNNKLGFEINHSLYNLDNNLEYIEATNKLEEYKLTCQDYEVDLKIFTLPKNIEFLKYEKMLTQINE